MAVRINQDAELIGVPEVLNGNVRVDQEAALVGVTKVVNGNARLDQEAELLGVLKVVTGSVRMDQESLLLLVPTQTTAGNTRVDQEALVLLVPTFVPPPPPAPLPLDDRFPCNTFSLGYGDGGYGEGGYGGDGTGPVGYYLSLMTSEYQNSPNFLAWLAAVLQVVSDIQQVLCAMTVAFDINNAVGVQLDVLGQLVGASRTVGFQPTGGVSPILDDSTYRIYIKAKIAQNQWDGQLSSLYAIWSYLFPGGRIAVQDNQNMTATVFVSGAFSSIIQDLITNDYIVPRPETVKYTYTLSTLPVFGFDERNAYIAGFDQGHFA